MSVDWSTIMALAWPAVGGQARPAQPSDKFGVKGFDVLRKNNKSLGASLEGRVRMKALHYDGDFLERMVKKNNLQTLFLDLFSQ